MGDSTATRPPPTASGKLAKTPFVHLLLYALDKKLGGTMEFFAPDKRTVAVVFAQGEPVKVRTSEPVAYLGQVLSDLGFVSRPELDLSLKELAKQKSTGGAALHGALLVSKGLLDATKLQAGLAEQTARKLHFAASLPDDTAYAFYEGFDALRTWGGSDSPRVDPVPHLWSMLREYTPWGHVTGALGRVEPSLLRLARGADVARLHLAKEEAAAVELLASRTMRASELARAGNLNERTAQILAYLLLVTRQVEVLAPADGAPTSGRTGSPPPPSARASVPPGAPLRPSGRTTLPPMTGRASAPPAPRSAVPPPPAGLSPELAERWAEIGERAATIDRADYFMMLDLARDATHEEVETAFFALAKRWHPDRLPAELAPVRDACSRVFARMSEAHTTLADDEQRARYMKLLAEGSGSPETQDAVAKVVEAAQNFQKAEVYLKRGDLAQAETFCKLALDADDTQPDYLALYAWLLALRPEGSSQEKTLESLKLLDRAVSMNNRCEKALYFRGMLNKRVGKADAAAKDFKRVVDLNPRNIDAAREIRLYEMRGGGRGSTPPPPRAGPDAAKSAGKGADPQKGGLFGRLFKK